MDAPEKIWTPANGQSIIPGGVKRWPTDVEYTRTDRANELVAAAYERMVDQAVSMADGRDEACYIEDRMRHAIPADATAALAARDARIREAAMETAISVAASLAAAISLLENGGKNAAPSDRMFEQMLKDYRKSLDDFRALIAKDKANG